jgi:photosystem II stability/assembly factor-like uncharacterized protein
MVSPQDGWAWGFITDIGMRFWHTSDGGQTWIDITPAPRAWGFEFALDAQTAWALVCQSPSDFCEETLAMTEDGGASWSVVSERIRVSLPVFHFTSKTEGVLTGYDVGAGSGFWTFSETSDGGQTWNRVEINSDPYGDSTSLFGLQTCNMCGDLVHLDQELLLILNGNLSVQPREHIPIEISSDRGSNWQTIKLDFPGEEFEEGTFHSNRPISFDDGTIIVPYNLAPWREVNSDMIFYSTKNGQNWRILSIVEDVGDVYRWNQFNFLPSQEIFFACGSELCVSQDGAQTWDRISSNLNFFTLGEYPRVEEFDFVDSQNGWALVEPIFDSFTLWFTTDGGRNWVELDPTFINQ